MANRILRDWTDSETIDLLSFQAEVLFIRLFMKADDYGCFHANPKLIKAALFPLKNTRETEVTAWLTECYNAGLIAFYTNNEKKYLVIRNFGQRLRNMRRKFPEPPPEKEPENELDSNSPQLDSDLRSIVSDPPPEVETETEVETKKKQKLEKEKKKCAPLVLLYDSEIEKLLMDYGNDGFEWMVNKLNAYKGSKGKTYKSDYSAILTWVVEAYHDYIAKKPKEEISTIQKLHNSSQNADSKIEHLFEGQ